MDHDADDGKRAVIRGRSFPLPRRGGSCLLSRRFGCLLLIIFIRRVGYLGRLALFLLFFFFFFSFVFSTLSKLVHTFVINLVLPALVKPDEKDHIVSKSSDSM